MSGDRLRIEDIEAAREVQPLTRLEKFRRGMIGVEDLDDEEILNGVVRQENGQLPSRRSKNIPREMQDEMKRRFFERGDELMQRGLFPAIRALTSIVEDEEQETRDRITAAKFIIERVMGKEVTVKIRPDDPVDRMFRELFESSDGLEDRTVPGEVVDDGAGEDRRTQDS